MTPREKRVQDAVCAMSDALDAKNLSLDDLVSAVFSLLLRIVLVLRTAGADMTILQGATMRLMAECMPPANPERMN